MLLTQPTFVIPAKAGIHKNSNLLDPGFHRGDVESISMDVGMAGVAPLYAPSVFWWILRQIRVIFLGSWPQRSLP